MNENKKILDYRISRNIGKDFESAILNNSSIANNQSESKLLDMALTIIFSNDDLKKTAEMQTVSEGIKNRCTFLLKNEIAINGINSYESSQKASIIEYAMIYITGRLNNNDLTGIMRDYIKCGGALL